MKKILAFTLGIITTIVSYAQTNIIQNIEATYVCDVIVDYDQIIKTIPSQYRSQVAEPLKAEIANGISMNYFLKNNGKYSSFQIEEKISNSQNQFGVIEQQIRASESKPYYKDFTISPTIYLKEADLGSKKFLIKDQIPDFKWKITRDKADISGYKATKAEGVIMDSIPVIAWYAPEIPIKDGPTNISGLPGLVIKAQFETSGIKFIYTLKDLKISEKEIKLTIPTKGNVITQEQFMAEIKKIQEQFKEMMGSGVDTN